MVYALIIVLFELATLELEWEIFTDSDFLPREDKDGLELLSDENPELLFSDTIFNLGFL